jgi:hypothetical protein
MEELDAQKKNLISKRLLIFHPRSVQIFEFNLKHWACQSLRYIVKSMNDKSNATQMLGSIFYVKKTKSVHLNLDY